jgi:hypothetical protein
VIRGYAAPALGGSKQWVIGARQFGGYTDDMAAWGLNFDQAPQVRHFAPVFRGEFNCDSQHPMCGGA